MAQKHPKFKRPNMSVNKRVNDNWRKPHGIDSKQRQKKKWAGAVPKIGYQGPRKTRHAHPSGKQEFYVQSPKDLQGRDLKEYALRLSATLSKKSKAEIRRKAAENNWKVLN